VAGPRLATMAWRNLWRNRRRTVITLVSIAFGAMLAVIFTGLGDASYAQMIDHAARMSGGHVVVQDREYADAPAAKRSLEGAGALRGAALGEADVVRAVPRVTAALMLSTSTTSTGVAAIGIDPALEDRATLGLVEALAEGAFFAAPDERGIILGATLAENLGVTLGKKVVYTTTDKRGEIASGLARVTGIIRTGAASMDAGICLLPIDALRQVLGYAPDEVTQLAVFVDGYRQAPAVAARLGARAGADAAALTWDRSQPELAAFIGMKTGGMLVFEAIMTVLIAAGIFNTLFVSVMERLREFGIMAAIGFSGAQLFGLILWESVWLAICGLVAGVALVAGPYHHLSTVGVDTSKMIAPGVEVAGVTLDPILRVEIYPPHAVAIAAAIFLTTLLAGLYPAWRASRVVPVETIRIV